jgi:hypothetical protein
MEDERLTAFFGSRHPHPEDPLASFGTADRPPLEINLWERKGHRREEALPATGL